MRFFLLILVAAQIGLGGTASADNKDVARAAFAEGQRRYDLNEFGPALEAFKRAYLAYEEPAFLFNIAQCYRQLGDRAEAIKFYRSYLRKVPDAPNRDEVKGLVTTLESEIKAEKSAPPPPATAPSPATTGGGGGGVGRIWLRTRGTAPTITGAHITPAAIIDKTL